MKKQLIIKELILILLTVLPITYPLIYWSSLPDQLPIHFDFDGTPDGYGSKLIYILLPIGIYLLMLVLPYVDPRKSNYQIFSNTYFKLRLIINVLFGVIDSVVIYNTLHGIEKLGLFVPISIFLLFTLIGNYMGTIRPNYFVGIKVPWTLNNDEVWIRTHKMAGKLWFWAGLFGIVSLFVVKKPEIMMLPIIAIMVVIPIVYSYIIYQRITKQE